MEGVIASLGVKGVKGVKALDALKYLRAITPKEQSS